MSKSQFQIEYEEYQKYKEWQETLCCKNAEEVIDFVMSNYLTEDEKCRTIADQAQRINDLEAKLAESEAEHERLIDAFEEETEKLRKQIKEESDARKRFVEAVKELKQQLAEKEQEIKNVSIRHLDMLRYFIRHNSKQGIIFSSDLEREIEEIEQGKKIWQTKNFNQDKISFAVEQLDKFRDTMEKLNENNSGYIIRFSSMRDREKFHEAIDNQIKQLKEGK